MSETDDNVIAFLAERYPGATACRALWLWAGGRREQVEYNREPLPLWTRMWVKAAPGAAPIRIPIVRHALFDYPGTPVLLRYLKEFTSARPEEERLSGELLKILFERMPEPREAVEVAAALLTLPEMTGDELFAALTPPLEGHIEQGGRRSLESALSVIQVIRPGTPPEQASTACEATLQAIEHHIATRSPLEHIHPLELLKTAVEAAASAVPLGPPNLRPEPWEDSAGCRALVAAARAILQSGKHEMIQHRELTQLAATGGNSSPDPFVIQGIQALLRQFRQLHGFPGAPGLALDRIALTARHCLWATNALVPEEVEPPQEPEKTPSEDPLVDHPQRTDGSDGESA